MKRVLVVGITGAGKTTVARRLAAVLDMPFHEMDVLMHGPGWAIRPEFVSDVESIVATPAWVFDSFGHDDVRDLMWAAADSVVWLDFPRRVVLPRVLRRSLARSLSRRPVFGGNRETWRGWLSADHPVWWSMSVFRSRRAVLTELTRGSPQLRTIRFTRPAEVERWLATLR